MPLPTPPNQKENGTMISSSIKRLRRAITSNPLLMMIQNLGGAFILLISISPVQASLNMGRCCQKRAREMLVELDDNPWTVCGIGAAITDPLKDTLPNVRATRAWAMQTCPGRQLNSLDEWLQPLAQWFAPYLALLLLCPIGEDVEEEDAVRESKEENQEKVKVKKDWRHYLNKLENLCYNVKGTGAESNFKKIKFVSNVLEWISLLGDPSSAIWGGIAQLRMDTWAANSLWQDSCDGHHKNMLGVAIMASQTPMDTSLGTSLTNEFIIKSLAGITDAAFPPKKQRLEPPSITEFRGCLDNAEKSTTETLFRTGKEPHTIAKQLRNAFEKPQSLLTCLKTIKGDSWSTGQTPGHGSSHLESAIDSVLKDNDENVKKEFAFNNIEFSTNLESGIRSILDARIGFVNGVLLPVVVHFATTAAAFYQAYQKLGDNDTAHSLAYGALYSWLLIVVVVGNCVAANVNAKVVKTAIEKQFTLTGSRVPLRNRYSNNTEWKCWLTDIGIETVLTKIVERNARLGSNHELVAASSVAFGPWFYCKFLFGQFLGWACVAFFGCCAITISYTTPTVGWGCRSFNHLLYIVFSLFVAALQVIRYAVERKYQGKRLPIVAIVRIGYVLFVAINAFILIGGTIFHFSGLYHSYVCSRIFGPSTALLDLAPHTKLHVHNSQVYWYSTGYVAYCAAWVVCAFAVVFRKYIQMGIQLKFEKSAKSKNEGELFASEEKIQGTEAEKQAHGSQVKEQPIHSITP